MTRNRWHLAAFLFVCSACVIAVACAAEEPHCAETTTGQLLERTSSGATTSSVYPKKETCR